VTPTANGFVSRATSSPVITPTTPSAARAFDTSYPRMRACGWRERTIAAWWMLPIGG